MFFSCLRYIETVSSQWELAFGNTALGIGIGIGWTSERFCLWIRVCTETKDLRLHLRVGCARKPVPDCKMWLIGCFFIWCFPGAVRKDCFNFWFCMSEGFVFDWTTLVPDFSCSLLLRSARNFTLEYKTYEEYICILTSVFSLSAHAVYISWTCIGFLCGFTSYNMHLTRCSNVDQRLCWDWKVVQIKSDLRKNFASTMESFWQELFDVSHKNWAAVFFFFLMQT